VKRIDPVPIIDKEFWSFGRQLTAMSSAFACVCIRFSIHWASRRAFLAPAANLIS